MNNIIALLISALLRLLIVIVVGITCCLNLRKLIKACKGIRKMQEIPETHPDAIRMRFSKYQAENYTKAIRSNLFWTAIWLVICFWSFDSTGGFFIFLHGAYLLMALGSALNIPYNIIARKYGEFGYLLTDSFVNLVAVHQPPKTRFAISEEQGAFNRLSLHLHTNPKNPNQITCYDIIERQDEARERILQLAEMNVCS